MIEVDQAHGVGLQRFGNKPCSMENAGAAVPVENQRRNMAATKMTQTQLVRTLAEKSEVSNKVAKAFLENLAATAIGEVKKNGMFIVPGLGRLVRVERKARMGRNPATGEAIKIAAKKVVKFRVAKSAKDAIVPPKKK
jgi:DNA-binding protein HU-beta